VCIEFFVGADIIRPQGEQLIEIPSSTRQSIYKYLGDKTDGFLSDAKNRLIKCTEKRALSDIIFMETNTVNLLYSCESSLYGSCVLKMCIPGPEVATEINCLRFYDGKGYVKLWAYDLSDDLLLLENIKPGNELWDVDDYKERARFFALTIKGLPIDYVDNEPYPTYLSWMKKIHQTITDIGGLDDVLFYLNKAIEIYNDLKKRYNRECLLHGDMHQENLLLNSKGGYTIIDPKGVIDDPVMETARYLMNETPCDSQKIYDIVTILSPVIEIPEEDLLKSMYIDAALGNSWTMEEHYVTQEAFKAGKKAALKTCEFVYGLLN